MTHLMSANIWRKYNSFYLDGIALEINLVCLTILVIQTERPRLPILVYREI